MSHNAKAIMYSSIVMAYLVAEFLYDPPQTTGQLVVIRFYGCICALTGVLAALLEALPSKPLRNK